MGRSLTYSFNDDDYYDFPWDCFMGTHNDVLGYYQDSNKFTAQELVSLIKDLATSDNNHEDVGEAIMVYGFFLRELNKLSEAAVYVRYH